MSHELGELLDRAPCGFISFGEDSRIALVNQRLVDRLGFSREALIGQHVETVLATGSRIFYQTHFFPLVKLRGEASEIFMLLRAADGEDVGMLCNASRREQGAAHVIDCVFIEVQERRRFEDALLQARQTADRANATLQVRTREVEEANTQLEDQAVELEAQSEELQSVNEELHAVNEELQQQRTAADEANRAKSNFLAVMSHELRTPLNAIGGYVQLLQMGLHGPVNEQQLDALGRIDRSQRHLLRLINDVLNLSRIEAGRVDYIVERVLLAEVVRNVMPMVDPQIEAKRMHVEVSVPADIAARADREKVQQILLNLLTNAIKFTPEGGRVRVETGVDGSDSKVFLCVSDSGIGIPEDMIAKIFEPFVQVDASRSRSAEGTGLGLAISRDLARGMRGELTAKSNPGVGSTFQLELRRD